MKYKPINGWTKAKILEVMHARPFDEPATLNGYCTYLAPNGNKCAVGLFIPDGHEAQKEYDTAARTLITVYSDLRKCMPLDIEAMVSLQMRHDREYDYCRGMYVPSNFKGNAKAAMIDWVEKHVED